MILGQKQVLITNGSVLSGSYTVGASDNLGTSMIKGTLGASGVMFKVWTDGAGAGTLVIPAAAIPSWSDTAAASAALAPPFLLGVTTLGCLTAATAVSVFPSAARAAAHYLMFGPTAGAPVGLPCPSLYLVLTVATATITGVNIEARVFWNQPHASSFVTVSAIDSGIALNSTAW